MAKPIYHEGDECPVCKKGTMKIRPGKFGNFAGCTNFPRCKHNGNAAGGRGEVAKYTKQADNQHKGTTLEAYLANRKKRTWSEYQIAAFAWIAGFIRHCLLIAGAGAGKTTVLEELVARIHEHHAATGLSAPKIIILAFNRSIKQELADRIHPLAATVATLNGYGMSILTKLSRGKLNVDEWKIKNLIDDLYPATGQEGKPTQEERNKRTATKELVSLAMCYLQESAEQLADLAVQHMVEASPDIIVKTQQVLNYLRTHTEGSVLSYDEQLWIPVVLDLPCQQYDYVLVDESQDLSAVKLALATKALNSTGRMIAVGDPYQAIYGFCGALSDSMDQIQGWQEAHGGSKALQLPITYRCASEVVLEAQEDVPTLQAAPNAARGEVKTILDKDFPQQVKEADLVLCRVNAPLISYCLMLIRAGIKATIMGKDTAKWLENFLDKVGRKATTTAELLKHAEEYRYKEVQKLEALKNSNRAVEKLNDLLDTLVALTDGLDTVKQVKDRIHDIFDKEEGVKLSSIHRAKGLEADTVYILRPELLPHPMAKMPWELQQERNLRYVARTRAKSTLVYVENTKTK